jgi:hypothetical protein
VRTHDIATRDCSHDGREDRENHRCRQNYHRLTVQIMTRLISFFLQWSKV